jgi:hypothetical protein
MFFACKNEGKEEATPVTTSAEVEIDSVPTQRQDIDISKQQSITLKQEALKAQPDEKEELQQLVINKQVEKEADLYTLDFTYPLLNTNIKRSYANFNDHIEKYYVDVTGTEAAILEAAEMICDTVRADRFQEKRTIDYKVYNVNERLISVLFYKENFYANTLHPSYSFDCMNYDLERSVFMTYEDFFVEGSEEELRSILNELLNQKIASGELYYDCWAITADDFFTYKNNFVVNDAYVEYYFDDCVICPSYTGTYSIQIPLERLLPVLRKYKNNPLSV